MLPVPADISSDHISNGIALSPTIHRAFDNGLIYLTKDYMMMLNRQKANELADKNRSAGLNNLSSLLSSRIHLPADQQQWPNPQFIVQANRYRRIPDYC
jgi:putative restriction endonuclease